MLKYNKNIYVEPSPVEKSLISAKVTDKDGIDPHYGTTIEKINVFRDENPGEYKIKEIKRDSRNIKFGLSIPNEITMINVNSLINREVGFSPYDYLSKEDKKLMKSSIERCGVIHPLIVLKVERGEYMLIDGENRGICLSEMFDETGDIRYEKVPCIVLTSDNFDRLDLREICISANLNKKCNGDTQRKVILMMHGIYRSRYTRLKEINVAREIAGKLGISVSTVYNYLKLENLCLEAQRFLNNGIIDLTSASKLANLKIELQVLIIREIGEENVSNHFIRGAVKKDTDMKNYKSRVKNVFSWRHPFTYSIKISGKYKEMEVVEKMIDDYFNHHTFELKGAVKKRVFGKCFDFHTGLSSLGEREIRIPKYFQKFIEEGEIGEYIPDSHFSNIEKYKKKGKIVKTQTKLSEKPEIPEDLENVANPNDVINHNDSTNTNLPQNEVSKSENKNEEDANTIEIDYNDLFRESES